MKETEVSNALSFDVEEYFHALNFRSVIKDSPERAMERRVEKGTARILELLAESSGRATFFILGEVARENPGLIREIAEQGHEIASHGLSHKTVPELGPRGFRREARESRKALEDITGRGVYGFRASTFSITREVLWALEVLREEGYEYDSSIFPVLHDRYGIPDFPRSPVRFPDGVIEFPLLTLRLPGVNLPCGGGGYFRLFPLFVTLMAVRRMNAAGWPAVLYMHPWEFDPLQPRHRLGGLKTFRHYVNIKRTGKRLSDMLKRFTFVPLGDLASRADEWPEYRLGGRDD